MTAKRKNKSKTAKSVFNCFQVNTAAHQAYIRQDYKSAAKTLLVWKKELDKLGSKDEGAAYAFWLIGVALYMSDKYAQCEPYLLKSSRIYKNLKLPQAQSSLWLHANSLFSRKRYKSAATAYFKIGELAQKNDKSGWRCSAFAQGAHCLWTAKDSSGALAAFEISLTSSQQAPLPSVSGLAEKLLQLYSAEAINSAYRAKLRNLFERASKLVSRKLAKHKFPSTEIRPAKDLRFGHVINDPFRWLEDVHSDDVQKWMTTQITSTNQYIDVIPGRSEVFVRIHKLYAVKPPRITYKNGPFYFTENKPLTRLYRSNKLGAFPKLVLSSDELPANTTLNHTLVSGNGKYVAYWVMEKGSDWQSIYVKNMSTGKRVTGILKNLRASSTIWGADNRGFYYASFSKDSEFCQIRYHKLGTSQQQDKKIYTIEDPGVYAGISMVGEGKYLLVTTYGTKRDRHSLFLINIQAKRHKRLVILDEQSSVYGFIGQKSGRLFFLTDKNAPMNRIVSVSLEEIEKKSKVNGRPRFHEELPEKPDSLKRAFNWGDFLVCLYTTKNGEVIERRNTKTKKQLSSISLPAGTSILSMQYMEFPVVRMVVEGYTVPTMIYELNFETGKMVSKAPLKSALDMKQFVTEQLYARSPDGSKIPFHVRYKKGLKLNGNNPTILTGYGGFDRDINPSYDNYDLLWMDLGGICVEAVLRGDSGLGAEWRKEGKRENKQRTFDDFIAVAQSLIRKKYTQPSRLGIYGYSNGGLLVGAALTQRPDLFGAVEIGCGLLDMLRYEKFGTEKHWISEYGSATSKKYFEILRDYSPLHNVKKRAYPPVLINTGSHDDRVSPAHSYKFAATLQKNQTGDAPILLNIEMDAGHGFSEHSNMGINRLAFFGYILGLMPKQFLK